VSVWAGPGKDLWLALVDAAIHFRVPSKAVTFLTSWATISFLKMTVYLFSEYLLLSFNSVVMALYELYLLCRVE
jgi:hypothetical protein